MLELLDFSSNNGVLEKILIPCLHKDFYSLFSNVTQSASNAALGLGITWEWELYLTLSVYCACVCVCTRAHICVCVCAQQSELKKIKVFCWHEWRGLIAVEEEVRSAVERDREEDEERKRERYLMLFVIKVCQKSLFSLVGHDERLAGQGVGGRCTVFALFHPTVVTSSRPRRWQSSSFLLLLLLLLLLLSSVAISDLRYSVFFSLFSLPLHPPFLSL